MFRIAIVVFTTPRLLLVKWKANWRFVWGSGSCLRESKPKENRTKIAVGSEHDKTREIQVRLQAESNFERLDIGTNIIWLEFTYQHQCFYMPTFNS